MEHMLLLCLRVGLIWFGGCLNYQIPKSQITSLSNWLQAMASMQVESKEERGRVLSVISFTCWQIWKALCAATFAQKPVTPNQVIHSITCWQIRNTFVAANLRAQVPSYLGDIPNSLMLLRPFLILLFGKLM